MTLQGMSLRCQDMETPRWRVLFMFFVFIYLYYWISISNYVRVNTTASISGTETAWPSIAPEITSISSVCVAQSLVFCAMICRQLFVLLCSFGHYIVCLLKCWLLLWYSRTFLIQNTRLHSRANSFCPSIFPIVTLINEMMIFCILIVPLL